ncbi:hypothetical protein HYW32_03335 [Candidatus Berkelbacteria bacterium]|nr:hypothetical protein [Candidatus Berkelbacteria bacterium]
MKTAFNAPPATRGFGLLEVVLATGILALVVTGAVALLNGALRRANLSAERTTAMNLAQEGIELVRAARDITFIDDENNAWDANLPISTDEGTLQAAGSDPYGIAYVLVPGSGGLYAWQLRKNYPPTAFIGGGIANGIQTIPLNDIDYQREVYVTVPSLGYVTQAGLPNGVTDDDIIRKIKVIVRWGDSAGQAVESITYLTNWRTGT